MNKCCGEMLTIFLNEVTKITENIYLTGFMGVTNRNIEKYKITCLVSVIMEVPAFYIRNCEIYKVKIFDRPKIKLFKYFDQVSDKLHEIEQSNGRALVNCFGGVSRSPVMVIAFLMKYHRMTLREAHDFLLEKRIYIRPNINFWRQLVEYERMLFDGQNSITITSDWFGDIPDCYKTQKKTFKFFCADIYIRSYEIIFPSELRKKLRRLRRRHSRVESLPSPTDNQQVINDEEENIVSL